MKLSFRQGIVRVQQDIAQTPGFLRRSALDNDYIDLIVSPDPTIVTFAYDNENYTLEEFSTVTHAWGPFPPTGQTQYLYWDLDIYTGDLTRGWTVLTPVVMNSAPLNPQDNQTWFDTSTNIHKAWNGSKWNDVLRVFAGIYDQTAVLIMNPTGSHVGLDVPIHSGYILYDKDNNPIRDRYGKFLTSEHTLSTHGASEKSASAFKIESTVKNVQTDFFIPKHSLVSLVGQDRIEVASYARPDRLISGIVGEDFFANEHGRLISYGTIYNEQWNWPDDSVNKFLFCGQNGEITLSPPPTGISQIIGYVLDARTIELNIQMAFIL